MELVSWPTNFWHIQIWVVEFHWIDFSYQSIYQSVSLGARWLDLFAHGSQQEVAV